MNTITTTQDTKAVALYSGSSLVPRNMDEAIRLAEFMCRARTLPKHLWDSPGDCLMVVELAMRWGMSPFAVAQATSVISGKQMIEGKLVAAAVENSGAIVGHIDYQFSGEGEGRSITVTATRRGETNPRTVTVAYKDARTNNEMWKRQPDQQLVYHGARVWARRWTPAVILGVYSREEMGPIIEGEAIESTATDAREQMNRDVPLKAAAATAQRGERKVDPTVYETGGETDEQKWLRNLETKLSLAQSRAEVVAVGGLKSVRDAVQSGPPEVKRRVSELLADAYERLPEEEFTDEELGEIEIAGADKVAAG